MQVAEGEVNPIAQITAEFGGIKDGVLGEDTVNPTMRLKAEFDYARLCFKNIPTALQDMKKVDPNGRLVSSCDRYENKISIYVSCPYYHIKIISSLSVLYRGLCKSQSEIGSDKRIWI